MDELTDEQIRDRVPIQRFTKYFIEQTQKQLAGEGATEEEIEKYGVADLIFAFNNGKMMKLLIKRAGYLSKTKFEKA